MIHPGGPEPSGPGSTAVDQPLDVVVVGAGFSGLYALYRMRALGLRTLVLERGDGVGGTWYWNRYPGARCDIESVEYSYSFSDVVQQEWTWSELLPSQPELEAYLNFVADRLDLRPHVRFGCQVDALTFREDDALWEVTTSHGDGLWTRFVIAATGILSAPLDPDIPGVASFGGTSLLSSRYPLDGFDYRGKRVAIIGTGSTGVQATPVVAEEAAHLYVFQRSAAYTFPSHARPFEPGEFEELRSRYPDLRAAQRRSFIGAARLSAFSVLLDAARRPALASATREEQDRAVDEHGVTGALLWSDVLTDPDANRQATALYGEAVARIVHDPATAAALVPTYPFGCKRPIIDQGYYQAFNRDNVTLVDLRAEPMRQVVDSGIETARTRYDLDVILYATGFDAITGALTRMDVRGRAGAGLAEVWGETGPASYLGLQVTGFPNLFTIQGPGSPAATANFVAALEHQVDWIGDCIDHLRATGRVSIEALPSAQQAWTDLTASLVEGSVLLDPSCHSWWNGGNVPGKKRVYLSWVGGVPDYRQRCDRAAAEGYAGFSMR